MRRFAASSRGSRSFVLLATTATLCAACGESSEMTATQPLVVGNSPWPGFIAQFVAEEKGFYAEEGIRVREKHAWVATDINEALAAGTVDIAWTGISDVVSMANEDPSLRLIAVSDYSDGADGILARGVLEPADLIDKTIAWNDLPLQVLLLQAYLEGSGIEIDDLDLQTMPPDNAITAYSARRVDAVITFEPYLSDLLEIDELRRGEVVFSSRGTNLIAGSLVGKQNTLTDRKEDIEAYIRALEKGYAFYKQNPEEALAIAANKLQLPVEEIEPIMDNIRLFSPAEHATVLFNPNNPLNVIDSIEFAAEAGAIAGTASPSVDASSLYDDAYTQGLWQTATQ